MQRVENPYEDGTLLYNKFSAGWYAEYIGTQILSLVVGGTVLKTVTIPGRFAEVSAQLITKIDDVKTLLKATNTVRISEKIGALLVTKSST